MTVAYLDNNASAPIRKDAAAAALDALSKGGNPSSVHASGRAARALVDQARERVARLIGGTADGVVFTSGATEANALALSADPTRRLIVSAAAHVSILENARASGRPLDIVPVDRDGLIKFEALDAALASDARPALVSVMLANNETGVLQPVAEIARKAKRHGALVHSDVVQAVGRVDVDMAALGIDYATLSSHKIGGPQGVGALWVGPDAPFYPTIRGGAQEGRRRAGTENVPGIAGFGAAAMAARGDLATVEARRRLRNRIETALTAADVGATVFGAHAPRLWNTTMIDMPGVPAETQVIALDLAGVAVSAGSACSSGKVERSHVLDAMGVSPEIAKCAIRISLGWASTDEDVGRLIAAWTELRKRTRARAAA